MKNLALTCYRKLLLLLLICKLSGLQAQVLVHEEPRHKPVFQNESIRILNVYLPPADTTLYHLHHTPSLFIFFTSTNTAGQVQGGQVSSGISNAGSLLFEDLSPPHTRLHQVWNIDTDTFHVMDVELLMKDTGFAQAPLSLPGVAAEISTPWVRAYTFSLAKGATIMLGNRQQPIMLVAFSHAAIQATQGCKRNTRQLQAGSFMELKKQQSLTLKNTSNHPVKFALLELAGSR